LSRSTFDVQFRTKRRLDLARIAQGINSGEGVRSISRDMKIRPETVDNRICRLGHQALAILALARSSFTLQENLAADGLVSFTHSQYFPAQYQVLAGSSSEYWHVTDYAVTRRSGTMTEVQKKQAKRIYGTAMMPKGSVDRSFQRVYALALKLTAAGGTTRIFDTDEHYAYPRAMAKVDQRRRSRSSKVLLNHRTTSSKAPRTRSNPLAAVNYLDREIRKDCANHTRETVQWSKDANRAMLRMSLYMCWHNFQKPWRIKAGPLSPTHGEVAGLSREFCEKVPSMLYDQRVFHHRVKSLLCPSEQLTWFHRWSNPHTGKTPKIWPCVVA
jgi:hypothetical protein